MINLKHDITIAVSKGRILEEGLILLKKLEIETVKLSEKLNNKNFRNKAPEKIIEKFEADHEDLIIQVNKQKVLLENLEKIDN